MEYRGYTGTVRYEARDAVFHGWVEGLRDTITYEAEREELLENAFREAVDEYLEQCRACEQEPEPPPLLEVRTAGDRGRVTGDGLQRRRGGEFCRSGQPGKRLRAPLA